MAASPPIGSPLGELLAALAQGAYRSATQLRDLLASMAARHAPPEQQLDLALAAIERSRQPDFDRAWIWSLYHALDPLLRRPLPLTHSAALALVEHAADERITWHLEPYLITQLAPYLSGSPRTPELDAALARLVGALEARPADAARRKRLLKLKDLAGAAGASLKPGEPWANAALADIAAAGEPARTTWALLLRHCAAATGSAPSAKWRATAKAHAESLGADAVRAALARWLPLVDRPRAEGSGRGPLALDDSNADVLRGLAWLAADLGGRDIARDLAGMAISAYRKLPGVGPRSLRVANACVWALGQLDGQEGLTQLARLKSRVRLPAAQKQIAAAMGAAAARAGLAPDDLEELLVPTYGLESGVRRETLGGITVELAVAGGGAELRFTRADGRRLASAPRALKEQHGEELKELTQATADIKAMLPAQRDRIEQLYLQRRSWPLPVWRERYLDHPLVGALARRLIWRFESAGRAASGIPHGDQIVDAAGQPLSWLDGEARVSLWHPLDSDTAEILAWRAWLAAGEIQQPFKQAHREIYLLTDAERATRVYSNRFAAHIIRQHQFNALCAARGWKNQLRLMVDDSYPPPQRLLPQWGLRAEYWVNGVGDTFGADTNETGTFLHLATDQVRFYPIDAAQRFAHAFGDYGYQARRGGADEPIPLDQIPALALSEVLRDVDLFVGVASVGNDPTWADGGPQGRHRDYWARYAFGDLSESAKTRREVLERLIPRLAIAPRCSLADRFLVVRGDLRTYKIHLGSGNIMMAPDDQYLCIVPARGSGALGDATRFVPFEGDATLSIILSKAMLLAGDAKISDPSITRQISGR